MNQNNQSYYPNSQFKNAFDQAHQLPDGGNVMDNNAQYKQMQNFINGIQQAPQTLTQYMQQLFGNNQQE